MRTEDRILHLLKSRGPLMARDVGAALSMSTPGAQQQVTRMAQAGLVEPHDRPHGRGRPHRYWHLTDKGHARFPDRHADLTLEILQSTQTLFGAEGLEKLIAHREAETLRVYRASMADCRSLGERVRRLVELRNREGYMAAFEHDGDGYLLVENHCPICAAAAVCQGFCRAELSIFQHVLGDDVEVTRTDHILAGARRCAYRISPRS